MKKICFIGILFLTFNPNNALTSGNVYYSIKQNGGVIVGTIRFNNNSSGEYINKDSRWTTHIKESGNKIIVHRNCHKRIHSGPICCTG